MTITLSENEDTENIFSRLFLLLVSSLHKKTQSQREEKTIDRARLSEKRNGASSFPRNLIGQRVERLTSNRNKNQRNFDQLRLEKCWHFAITTRQKQKQPSQRYEDRWKFQAFPFGSDRSVLNVDIERDGPLNGNISLIEKKTFRQTLDNSLLIQISRSPFFCFSSQNNNKKTTKIICDRTFTSKRKMSKSTLNKN